MQNGFGVQPVSAGEQGSIGNPIMEGNGPSGTRASTPRSPGHGIGSTMVMSPQIGSDVDELGDQVKSENRSDDESGRSKGSKKVRKPRTIYR